jgi:hypothetical protein
MPAFGDLENSVAGLEDATSHIARLLAGKPNHDWCYPSRVSVLDLFLAAPSDGTTVNKELRGNAISGQHGDLKDAAVDRR